MAQRVLIADPDPRVRRGLRALLETQPDMVVIGEADTAEEVVKGAAVLHPSVVLLDLALPTVTDGLDAVRLLTENHQPCVVTSWQAHFRKTALAMGAAAFVEKGCYPERALAAIRAAVNTADQVGAKA
jgi:DNA-binding NarL/FixJ family response regulator